MKLPHFTSDVFLAPMAGVTEVAFRLLCREYGAALVCTEMVSANALSRSNKATLRLIDVVEEEKPRVIQLFGQNIDCLVQSTTYLQDRCEIIDLNFGCPAAQIIRQGAGSALLERLAHIGRIVEAVYSASKIPITCKLRLGINKHKINVLEVAKICEDAGASMITVHARTQNQGYTGQADWTWIKKVKETVSIPICGNGDVRSVEDYIRMKKETGCDYVMIGRAAVGNPYLFKQISDYNQTGKYLPRTPQQQINDFSNYLNIVNKYRSRFEINLNQLKFQAQSFTKGIKNSSHLRNRLSVVKTEKELFSLMREMGFKV